VAARTIAIATRRAAIWVALNIIRAVKASAKGLILLIAAGGKIALIIIVVVSLAALLLGSVFGIFFSGEENPNTGQTLNSVIIEIDTEYEEEIDSIISNNPHDLLDMSGARAMWRDVLAVYTVRTVTDPDNPMEVAMMDDDRAQLLRTVFWEMNAISYIVETYDLEVDILDEDDIPTGDTEIITQVVLRITVEHMTVDEAIAYYSFSDEQKSLLSELLLPEYASLWNSLLYGITNATLRDNATMIEIAISQLGNVGGEIYWRWYGFDSREPWCAIFVSWVANQSGLIQSGAIPMFASTSAGVQWFQNRGLWQPRGYTPAPGDLIFFDRTGSGTPDHVGIVERVDGGVVHTIEGNSSDMVRRRSYPLNRADILGYGVVMY
jgi:hypothetical protein